MLWGWSFVNPPVCSSVMVSHGKANFLEPLLASDHVGSLKFMMGRREDCWTAGVNHGLFME